MEETTNDIVDKEKSLGSSKTWLQRLKEESWEAELLVSTISIFGTFQMFNLISWSINRFIDLLNPDQYIRFKVQVHNATAYDMVRSEITKSLQKEKPGLIGLGGLCTDFNFISDNLN